MRHFLHNNRPIPFFTQTLLKASPQSSLVISHEQKARVFKVEQSEQLESAIIVYSLIQDLSRGAIMDNGGVWKLEGACLSGPHLPLII